MVEQDVYGLLGKKLGHSFSQALFNDKFKNEHINARYDLFEVSEADDIPRFLADHRQLKGLNVTIPYKEAIIKSLDGLSETAYAIGAVNVVEFRKDGSLIGHNTDAIGFSEALKPYLREELTNALVLGTGGASKAVCYALTKLGITPQCVSRKPKKDCLTYQELLSEEVMSKHLLIVNTTPLGMKPDILAKPDIPYMMLSDKHVCFDLVYNPLKTLFMMTAEIHGAKVCNGLEMLKNQALEAWKIWQT